MYSAFDSDQDVSILSVTKLNKEVIEIVTKRPEDFSFYPGQAAEVLINSGKDTEKHIICLTSIPSDNYLEFNFATDDNSGFQLHELKNNNQKMQIGNLIDTIDINGEGVFIAEGAGIIPFISILKDLKDRNELGNSILLNVNKTKTDIIHEELLNNLLGYSVFNILTEEKTAGYVFGDIDTDFLKTHVIDFDNLFYLSCTPNLSADLHRQLSMLGVDDRLIIENH